MSDLLDIIPDWVLIPVAYLICFAFGYFVLGPYVLGPIFGV